MTMSYHGLKYICFFFNSQKDHFSTKFGLPYRIPVDIWEAQCVPSESTDTHSCWRVTSQMLVLYRGECINGANT